MVSFLALFNLCKFSLVFRANKQTESVTMLENQTDGSCYSRSNLNSRDLESGKLRIDLRQWK